MKKLSLLFSFLISTSLNAQDDSLSKNLSLSGYVDVYYLYDFNKPDNHLRPSFLYNFNKHNEVNINLAYLKLNYQNTETRGNLSLMAGTYPQYNLSAEPRLLQNIFEANVGVKISKTLNLWMDAGILPSHIGFESAISKDCWNLTRSILAENSPYYESGVKLSYITKNENLTFAGLLLNGWQRIQRPRGNQTPAFGTQLYYKSTDKVTLNWSTFIGNEKPDSQKQWRYFNNLYGILQLHPKVGVTTGFDLGLQQRNNNSVKYGYWYSPVIIVRYQLNPKTFIATRAEYYNDDNEVILSTKNNNGSRIHGYSVNLDRVITKNALWRIETRFLESSGDVNSKINNPWSIATSLAISF